MPAPTLTVQHSWLSPPQVFAVFHWPPPQRMFAHVAAGNGGMSVATPATVSAWHGALEDTWYHVGISLWHVVVCARRGGYIRSKQSDRLCQVCGNKDSTIADVRRNSARSREAILPNSIRSRGSSQPPTSCRSDDGGRCRSAKLVRRSHTGTASRRCDTAKPRPKPRPSIVASKWRRHER